MAKLPAKRINRPLMRLLSAGYLPAELPPPFRSNSLAAQAEELLKLWDGEKIRKFWTSPEHYNVPRYGQARRKLSIVNPINQLHVAQLIADNWPQIRDIISRSQISEFKPSLVYAGGRAITGVNFDAVARRKAKIIARFGRYVRTDIARFYPSVYTHSIAWSVHGKEWCKANMKTPAFKNSYANLLDKAIAAGQSGQTVGIPIGPDTSRIVSELIATAIEAEIGDHVTDLKNRGVRYVDDIILGLDEAETADHVLSQLSSALYVFELELNAEKTSVHGIGFPHAPEWINFIRSFKVSGGSSSDQRDDIDSFFEQVLYLADANPRDNVSLFGAKKAASFDIHEDNWHHLVRWFLYLSRRSSTVLSFAVQHLTTRHDEQPLPIDEIETFITASIPRKAEMAHTSEVSWLLFWARELEISLPASVVANVLELRSSVCGLLLLDLHQRGLIDGRLNLTFWTSFANIKGLTSEMWLLAYEATAKDWWPRSRSTRYVERHEFFGELIKRDVKFYEPSRRSRPQVGKPFFDMLAAIRQWEFGGYP